MACPPLVPGLPRSPLLWLLLLAPSALAWDSGDLELFDLVEEIPQNFYAFLGVEQVRSAERVAPERWLGPSRFRVSLI